MKLKLPSWLRKDKVQLPAWASVRKVTPAHACILITVDTDGYLQEWLPLLSTPVTDQEKAAGLEARPVDAKDQYWLEVAYQCAKLDVQSALVGTEFDPRTSGLPAEFHFSNAPQHAQKKHPVGRGAHRASKGKEARAHYVRIRGRLPF